MGDAPHIEGDLPRTEHESLMRTHVEEMHQFDADILSAIFGPFKSQVLGDRIRDEKHGMQYQVARMYAGRRRVLVSMTTATVALITDVIVRVS